MVTACHKCISHFKAKMSFFYFIGIAKKTKKNSTKNIFQITAWYWTRWIPELGLWGQISRKSEQFSMAQRMTLSRNSGQFSMTQRMTLNGPWSFFNFLSYCLLFSEMVLIIENDDIKLPYLVLEIIRNSFETRYQLLEIWENIRRQLILLPGLQNAVLLIRETRAGFYKIMMKERK